MLVQNNWNIIYDKYKSQDILRILLNFFILSQDILWLGLEKFQDIFQDIFKVSRPFPSLTLPLLSNAWIRMVLLQIPTLHDPYHL